MLADTRLGAQQRLSDTAHLLRATHPGMSLADCFELASLRDMESARLLDLFEESREARGHGPDASSVAAIMAGGLDLKARIRLYCRGADGKADRERVKALLTANRVWIAHYETVNVSALVGAAVMRLMSRASNGHEVRFP